MKIEEFQRLGKNVKVIIRKFTENPGKFASVVLQMYWDIEKERDSYKQQRDELINDIAQLRERNSELERKAQAFDFINNSYTTEIEQAIKNKELNQCLFLLEQILEDLEREE